MKTCTDTNFAGFNRQTRPMAEGIVRIIEKFVDYLPLTVRQVFYQLVIDAIIRNHLKEYRKVSRILTKMRENEIIPWSAITDRTRYTIEKRGVTNLPVYIRDNLEWFLPRNYGRCYVQNQENYIEVSTEKDALSSILEREVWKYCTRLNVVRGQTSATFVEAISRRFDAAVMRGQNPILIHFGDLDPSGIAIPKAVERNFKRRHGIDVDVRHVALTPEQVDLYQLPVSLDAVKSKDPNYKAWVEAYGTGQRAVELDALNPKTLREILQTELAAVYNLDGMADEAQMEIEERAILGRIYLDMREVVRNHGIEI